MNPWLRTKEPRYKIHRPRLTKPRMSLWKTDTFDSDIVPNDLHWAAEKGNINLLAHLLMQNHDVNATDSLGRTALHEAAENNQLQTADWLVFEGANAHAKDYENSTPMSLCRSEEMARILSRNATRTRPGILILMEDTSYQVDDLDIRVITGQDFAPSPSYMTCRRLAPSKSSLRSRLLKGERFWRDVIEYRVSVVTRWTEATIDILVADLPTSSSELVLKVEDGDGRISDMMPKINKITVQENECWLCRVKIKLDFFGCFVLFSRPRSESIPIPRSGGHFVARSNSSVRLNVPPQAFKRDGNLLFTIEEMPEHEQEENILSMSHFFKIDHSTCSDASEDFEVSLPIPDGYTGSGDVVVLSRPGSSVTSDVEETTDEENNWEVKEATVEPDRGCVSFKTRRMGINSPIEVQKGTNREELRRQSPRIYSKIKECHVKFLVVGKILGFNQFDLVVECVKSDQIYLRIQEWKDESYTKLRLSGDFLSTCNQKYRLELQGNVKCLYGLDDLHLEFLPGQTSHQSLLVQVINTREAPNGNVAIHKLTNNGIKLVTQLPILLEEQLGKSSELNKDTSPKEPTNEKMKKDKYKSRIPRRLNSFPGYNKPLAGDKNQHLTFDEDNFLDYSDVDNDKLGIKSFKEQSVSQVHSTAELHTQQAKPSFGSGPSDVLDIEELEEDFTQRVRPELTVRSSLEKLRIRTRQDSNISKDCLPVGVGESVIWGEATNIEEDYWSARRQSLRHPSDSSNEDTGQPSQSFKKQLSQELPSTSEIQDRSQHALSAPVSDNFFVQLVKRMQPNFLLFIELGLTNADINKIKLSNNTTEYAMFEVSILVSFSLQDPVNYFQNFFWHMSQVSLRLDACKPFILHNLYMTGATGRARHEKTWYVFMFLSTLFRLLLTTEVHYWDRYANFSFLFTCSLKVRYIISFIALIIL